MAKRSPGIIDSVDTLRRRMRTIVAAVNEDPGLAERAAANPILALEELGYALSDRFRPEAELRARFPAPDAKRVAALRSEVEEHLGAIDISSADSIVRALRTIDVHLPSTVVVTNGAPADVAQDEAATAKAPARVKQGRSRRKANRRRIDPVALVPSRPIPADAGVNLVPALRASQTAHAVIRPLADYLELEASRPGLATQRVYERLRERPPDPTRSAVTITFHLQSERDEG
jgi:hypothetical protein